MLIETNLNIEFNNLHNLFKYFLQIMIFVVIFFFVCA